MSIEKLFEGVDLSDDTKDQITTIFEAKVAEKVDEKTKILEEKLAKIEEEKDAAIQEAADAVKAELTSKVDDFLNYAVSEWAIDNQISIENGVKVEIAEAFTVGIKNVLSENNIEVGEKEHAVTKKLQEKVTELESKLNESISKQVKTHKDYVELKKEVIVSEVCEDLAETQIEKIFKLSEDIEFKDEESYTKKITTLKENYFPKEIDETNKEESESLLEGQEEKPNQSTKSKYTENVTRFF